MPWVHLQHPPENGGRKGGQGYSSQHPLVRSDNQYQEGIISKVSICNSHIRAIFVWPWNVVSVSVRYLFISQWMNRSKHGLLVFLPKKTVIWRKHKFDWAIMLQNNVKATYWFISWKVFGHEVFSVERSLSGAFAPFVSIWQTNQSTLFLFICCFCFVCAFSFQSHTKIALLRLLEKVFELLVTVTKHILNLVNNDFMMLWITLFFATPAKLLHLLVPSEYDWRKPFTNTKSSFYAKSDWLYVPRWYLSYPVCVKWKLRMAFVFLYISLLWHTWHACLDEDPPQEWLKPPVEQLKQYQEESETRLFSQTFT